MLGPYNYVHGSTGPVFGTVWLRMIKLCMIDLATEVTGGLTYEYGCWVSIIRTTKLVRIGYGIAKYWVPYP